VNCTYCEKKLNVVFAGAAWSARQIHCFDGANSMRSSSPEPILLSSTLDLLASGPLRTRLSEALNATPALELDGSKVERVSTACLQLLLSAAATARRSGGSVVVKEPSPVLSQALLDLGFAKDLLGSGV